MSLPLRLPGETMTRIIEAKVAERLGSLVDRVHAVIPDNIFPGTKELPATARTVHYLQNTDPQDLPLLLNPDYLEVYQAGIAPALVSPFWLSTLSVPYLFKEMQRDFVNLLQKAVSR